MNRWNFISLANMELKLWLFRTWGVKSALNDLSRAITEEIDRVQNVGIWIFISWALFVQMIYSSFSRKHIFIKSKCIAKWLHSVCRNKYTLSSLKGHNLKNYESIILKMVSFDQKLCCNVFIKNIHINQTLPACNR